MNNDIADKYDNTNYENYFNPYNDSSNIDCTENYDFFSGSDHRRESFPMSCMELPYRMDRMESLLRALLEEKYKKQSKKHKKHKKYKKYKKHKNEGKSHKKFLKAIEKQKPDKHAWLKNIAENCAPQVIDLLSDAMMSRRQLTSTPNQPLGLPDKSSTK